MIANSETYESRILAMETIQRDVLFTFFHSAPEATVALLGLTSSTSDGHAFFAVNEIPRVF